MIQDISPYVFDNSFKNSAPDDDSYMIVQLDGKLLIKEEYGEFSLPLLRDTGLDREDLTYLLSVSGKTFYMCGSETACKNTVTRLFEKGFGLDSIGSIRRGSPRWLCFTAAVAFQLSQWYLSNRFCGCCGGAMVKKEDERALVCERCGNIVYPKISPAIIAGVINGNRILLTKYAGRANSPSYALVAGFAEIGETIEETVKREVFEETGIRVKNLRYYKSQPWPFSDTLLFGFFCDADGSTRIKLDESELSVAEWVSRSEMDLEDDGISLTREMINAFKTRAID